jgi:hypothetical protein
MAYMYLDELIGFVAFGMACLSLIVLLRVFVIMAKRKNNYESYQKCIRQVAKDLRTYWLPDYRPETDNPIDEAEVEANDIFCSLTQHLSDKDREIVSEIYKEGRPDYEP